MRYQDLGHTTVIDEIAKVLAKSKLALFGAEV
jgi:hypothetical protein